MKMERRNNIDKRFAADQMFNISFWFVFHSYLV